MHNFLRICTVIVLVAPPIATAASARIETGNAGNVYLSGSNLQVDRPVSADLLAAGGKIRIDQNIGADAALAGGSIDIRAEVGQDLRAAAGTLDIGGNIGGELVAAGGTIRLDQGAMVSGAAWLAGSDVVVAGRIANGAKIAANKITLSGQIDGDTRLYAREIQFLPGAKIIGNLTYASPTALEPAQAAQVQGTVSRDDYADRHDDADRDAPNVFWLFPVFLISMLLVGALLYRLFPNAIIGVQQTIRETPLRSLLIGLALLFTVPPVAILLMVTIIGMPIGVSLLMLYPLMLMLGFLASAFYLGRRAADAMKQPRQLGFWRQILFLGLALIVLLLLITIPFVGMLVFFVALVAGIGGWAVSLYRRQDAASLSGPA